MSDLLAPNSTVLERRLAQVGAKIERVSLDVIRAVWNPGTCPVEALPHLAWAFSVDRWDKDWPESVKRAVINAAYMVHKRKGTRGAVRRVVEPFGYVIRFIEWFEETPPAPPGTFKLDIGVLDSGITDETYDELSRLIDDAKPLSRAMTGLAISMEVRGIERIHVGAYLGDELTVYPFLTEDIVSSGHFGPSLAAHLIDTMTIQPLTA